MEIARSNLSNFYEHLLWLGFEVNDTMSNKSSLWLHFVKMETLQAEVRISQLSNQHGISSKPSALGFSLNIIFDS